MMEASTISVNQKPNEQNLLSVGLPVQNVKVKIENGLLYIKGSSISSTYINGNKVLDRNTVQEAAKGESRLHSEYIDPDR